MGWGSRFVSPPYHSSEGDIISSYRFGVRIDWKSGMSWVCLQLFPPVLMNKMSYLYSREIAEVYPLPFLNVIHLRCSSWGQPCGTIDLKACALRNADCHNPPRSSRMRSASRPSSRSAGRPLLWMHREVTTTIGLPLEYIHNILLVLCCRNPLLPKARES